MKNEYPIVVLISGRGSNLKALIEGAKHYQVVAVISNRSDAAGLDFAREAGIPALAFDRAAYTSLQAQKEAIYSAVRELRPALTCLAGFMQIVEPGFTEEFKGRLINIHPALLPAFQGLDSHARALQARAAEHGCSVHFVDSGVDTGAVIAQAVLYILPDDTEETLAARVLKLEHQLYSWVINNLASGLISVRSGKPAFSPLAREDARNKGFRLPAASVE